MPAGPCAGACTRSGGAHRAARQPSSMVTSALACAKSAKAMALAGVLAGVPNVTRAGQKRRYHRSFMIWLSLVAFAVAALVMRLVRMLSCRVLFYCHSRQLRMAEGRKDFMLKQLTIIIKQVIMEMRMVMVAIIITLNIGAE